MSEINPYNDGKKAFRDFWTQFLLTAAESKLTPTLPDRLSDTEFNQALAEFGNGMLAAAAEMTAEYKRHPLDAVLLTHEVAERYGISVQAVGQACAKAVANGEGWCEQVGRQWKIEAAAAQRKWGGR